MVFRVKPRRHRIIDPDRITEDPTDPLKRKAVSDLINVYLQDPVNFEKYYTSTREKLSNYSLTPVDTAMAYNRIQFRVNAKDKEDIIIALRDDTSQVKYVTKEWVYERSRIVPVNDPDFQKVENSWFYDKIGVFDAWEFTRGDSSVTIAVLDDGFDLGHEELKDKFVKPWNLISYNKDVYAIPNALYHGTHVSGSIVAKADNNFGISGVAPECKFMPIQISDESGYITISNILDGLFYALKNKADVINLSIALHVGSYGNFMSRNDQNIIRNNFLKDEEKLWNEVFTIAQDSNTIIVQAAGNNNILAGVDPMKRSGNCIVVGAINDKMDFTDFTNFGDDVDVYAPGKQIYSTLPDNQMGYLDGTSMASPIVAGCIALIKSYRPDLNVIEIINLIRQSVSDSSHKIIDLRIIFNQML